MREHLHPINHLSSACLCRFSCSIQDSENVDYLYSYGDSIIDDSIITRLNLHVLVNGGFGLGCIVESFKNGKILSSLYLGHISGPHKIVVRWPSRQLPRAETISGKFSNGVSQRATR